MTKNLRNLSIYTAIVFVVSLCYYLYVLTSQPRTPEHETFLFELGEGFGEFGLWLLLFIYARTLLKLAIGKGKLSERILPEFSTRSADKLFKKILRHLNRTHVHVGIATVAVILLHIALVGLPMDILFFPAVLLLVLWQGAFGAFLTFRYSPKELKKFSYLVHAQFISGMMIGIFAYFGHLLVD